MAGADEPLLSKEGVLQGDPLSMLMYAVVVLPLIRLLSDRAKWLQNWYADDASCLAEIEAVVFDVVGVWPKVWVSS